MEQSDRCDLTGQFLMRTRSAFENLKRRGGPAGNSCCAGKIICISSVHEVIPWAGHVNYAASKGGVMLMMKSIAQEVAPFRIRRDTPCAGCDPHADQHAGVGHARHYAELLKLIPYNASGEPEEIGRVAYGWRAMSRITFRERRSSWTAAMTLYIPGFETGG